MKINTPEGTFDIKRENISGVTYRAGVPFVRFTDRTRGELVLEMVDPVEAFTLLAQLAATRLVNTHEPHNLATV